MGEDPDPWLTERCVTYDTSFDLTVTNMDKNEDSYDATLLISLNNDPSLITVTIDGNTVTGFVNGTPSYQGVGPHGVWPTPYAEYNIGFIPMDGGTKTVSVYITLRSAEDMVHFDAVGFDIDGNLILKSPFSHDVTYTPEFTFVGSLLILVFSGIYFLRRRGI